MTTNTARRQKAASIRCSRKCGSWTTYFASHLGGVARRRGARDHALHSMHGTMEKTHEGVHHGTVKLTKNADKLTTFVKMDKEFHEELETLAAAAKKNDQQAMLSLSKGLLDGCVKCHGCSGNEVSRASVPREASRISVTLPFPAEEAEFLQPVLQCLREIPRPRSPSPVPLELPQRPVNGLFSRSLRRPSRDLSTGVVSSSSEGSSSTVIPFAPE